MSKVTKVKSIKKSNKDLKIPVEERGILYIFSEDDWDNIAPSIEGYPESDDAVIQYLQNNRLGSNIDGFLYTVNSASFAKKECLGCDGIHSNLPTSFINKTTINAGTYLINRNWTINETTHDISMEIFRGQNADEQEAHSWGK